MSKGEQTKRFILDKAAPLFNKKGVAGTSMSDIMEATKLAKGSLYVHFENKEVLARAAFDHNIQILKNTIDKSLEIHKSNYDKLIAYIDTFKNPNGPKLEGGCPMMNFGTEADDTDQVLLNRINQSVNFSQRFIANIVEEGKKTKEFQPLWNAEEFATIAFAMIEGGIMICRISGDDQKMQIIYSTLKKIIDTNTLSINHSKS